MLNDYDYTKEVSSNPDDRVYLSFNDDEQSWSPAAGDSTPKVTLTISGGDEPEDKYIDSITIDKTDNVKSVKVVVISANGDRSAPIVEQPEADGSVTVDIAEEGAQVEVEFVPNNPNDPSSVGVGPIAVKACSEAICSEELDESSWYNIRVSSNNAGKKGIRIDNQEAWKPDAEDTTPTVRIFMGEGRNVYIDSVRITEGTGVKAFSVQIMAIASEPGARPIKFLPEGAQSNKNEIGDEVKIGKSGAIIVITLWAEGDISDMSVGRIMTTACAFPSTVIQTVTTEQTTAYQNKTITTPFILTTVKECAVTVEQMTLYFPDVEQSDLIGYIDKNSNGEYEEDEEVNIGDEVEDGVVILIKDLCHNCTCDDGTLECSTESCEKDCEVNDWSEWGPCSADCSGGVRERTRTFTPGTPGGATCPCAEDMKEREYCNNTPCPVDGEWSSWSPWSVCSVSCGGGITRRYRQCSDPAPANNGDDCKGSALEVESCYTDPCPSEEEEECGENKFWSSKCDGPISCYDYADDSAYTEDDVCNPGCKCVEGMVDDLTGECVEAAKECNCFDPETGNVFQEGQTAKRDQDNDCEECTCEKGILTCTEVACNRDCGYTEWSEWKDCTNLMGGEQRRYREPNSPAKRGSGAECSEEELIDTQPCGSEECGHCIIDGVKYNSSEIVEFEPCKKKCFCNAEGEMQCESLEEECAECPAGYMHAPDALDCCKCIPEVSTTCDLKTKFTAVSVEMPTENGETTTCQSDGPVKVTTCAGACSSMDAPTFLINGEVVNHEKDCRCCSGRDYEEVDVDMSCDDNKSRTLQMQRFTQCECNVCSEKKTEG